MRVYTPTNITLGYYSKESWPKNRIFMTQVTSPLLLLERGRQVAPLLWGETDISVELQGVSLKSKGLRSGHIFALCIYIYRCFQMPWNRVFSERPLKTCLVFSKALENLALPYFQSFLRVQWLTCRKATSIAALLQLCCMLWLTCRIEHLKAQR